MKVSELIEHLKTQPQDLDVICECFSDYVMIDYNDIEIIEAFYPREDNWVANKRPDKPFKRYLCFSGS